MTMPVTQCLIKLHEEHHDLEDYQGGVPRWCSGCGDNAILAGDAAAVPRRGPRAGAHGLRVGHRLLEPASALHEDLRLPRHARPRVPDRRGRSRWRGRTCTCSSAPATATAAASARRTGSMRIRYNMNLTVDPARQPRLRADQEAGLADVAARPEEQHDAARRAARGAESADGDARRAERLVRRPGGRLDSRSCSTTSCARRTGIAASRSCASSSAAPSSCPRCSSRGCTIRSGRCC